MISTMGFELVRMDAKSGSHPDTSGPAISIARTERGPMTGSHSVSVFATSSRR